MAKLHINLQLEKSHSCPNSYIDRKPALKIHKPLCVNIYPSQLAVRHQWVSDTVIPYIEAVLPENIHPNQRNSQKYPGHGPNKYWKNSPKSKIYWVAGTFVGDFDVPNLCCCRHHSLCQVPRIMEDRRLILREKSNISMETYTKTDFVLNKVTVIPEPSLCALVLSNLNLPSCNPWIICWYCKIQAGTCLSKLGIALRHHSTETKNSWTHGIAIISMNSYSTPSLKSFSLPI